MRMPLLKIWLLGAVLLFMWFNPFSRKAFTVLESDAINCSESLATLEGLYLFSEAGASVKLPIVSGSFQGASNTLQKAIQYLYIADVVVVFDLFILKVTHAKVIAFLMSVLWVLSFWEKRRKLFTRALIICFCLNPELSIYTVFVDYIDQEVQLSNQDKLNQELSWIHHDYEMKEKKREEEFQARKEAQLKEDEQKGKRHLSVVQKVEDGIDHVVTKGGIHLVEDFRLTKKTMEFAAKKSLELVLNAFSSILFMYLLLPVGYLWITYRLIRHHFT